MKIKPVLVPDHDATDLRKLMDHFATAAQSATPAAQANRIRQQLTESAEPGVAEGVNDIDELRDKMQWLMTTYHMRSGAAEEAAYYDEDPETWKGSPWEDEYTGVAEARPDVMRHRGDKTVKIVKRAGKPIGEIGIDAEASSGNGQYYVKLYDGSYDAVGYNTAEEALAELKAAIKQGVSEGMQTHRDYVKPDDPDVINMAKMAARGLLTYAAKTKMNPANLLKKDYYALAEMLEKVNPQLYATIDGQLSDNDYNWLYFKAAALAANAAAKQGVAEGSMYGDEEVSWEKGGRRAPTGAFRNPAVVKTDKSIGTRVSDIGAGGKEYNVKTDKEWDKQSAGMAEAEAKGPFARVKTETLQQFWDSHKDEQNPAPVLADKLKRIRQELVRRKRAGVTEGTGDINVGDDVIITGAVKYKGATGVVDSVGRDGNFIVINLYNHGKQSFQSTDVSLNNYAGSDDEEARMYNAGEFREGYLDRPGQVDSPVASALVRRILLQRTDLLSKYGPEKVVQAVDEVANFVGDVEEIGSSDVSGWIRHVEQMLGNMEPGVTEDEVEEGWKSKLAAAGLAGAAALGGYAAGSSSPSTGFSNTKGIDQFNKPTAAQVQPSQTRNTGSGFSNTKGIDQFNKPTAAQGQTLRTQADLDAYNKTRPPGTSKLVNLPKDFEEDIAESVDPIEQLRADILRFAR